MERSSRQVATKWLLVSMLPLSRRLLAEPVPSPPPSLSLSPPPPLLLSLADSEAASAAAASTPSRAMPKISISRGVSAATMPCSASKQWALGNTVQGWPQEQLTYGKQTAFLFPAAVCALANWAPSYLGCLHPCT